ncbi:MAG: hypothetical protein ABI605_07840 [Rhizobacter sp.]
MSTPAQLRIAARIHFVLKHDLGEGINVAAMLSDTHEAREVLFVCQASGNPELVSLARQFVNAGKLAKPALGHKGDAPQDAAWSRNTSGFGVTHPSELSAPEESSWRSATQWLRRSSLPVSR